LLLSLSPMSEIATSQKPGALTSMLRIGLSAGLISGRRLARLVQQRAAIAVAAAAIALCRRKPAAARGPAASPTSPSRSIDAVVNISTSQRSIRAPRSARPPTGLADGKSFSISSSRTTTAQAATIRTRRRADQFVGLRLHHRSIRACRHQQSRHCRRRRDQRDPQRRHQAQGRSGRQGHQGRSRAARVHADKPLKSVKVRRFRQAAARRMGHRHRQPVQASAHGHRRHCLGAQSRYQFRAVRQLHPDRRRHQSRQFRRPLFNLDGEVIGIKHRDYLAVPAARSASLRGAVRHRGRRHQSVAPIR